MCSNAAWEDRRSNVKDEWRTSTKRTIMGRISQAFHIHFLLYSKTESGKSMRGSCELSPEPFKMSKCSIAQVRSTIHLILQNLLRRQHLLVSLDMQILTTYTTSTGSLSAAHCNVVHSQYQALHIYKLWHNTATRTRPKFGKAGISEGDMNTRTHHFGHGIVTLVAPYAMIHYNAL